MWVVEDGRWESELVTPCSIFRASRVQENVVPGFPRSGPRFERATLAQLQEGERVEVVERNVW